MFNINKNYAEIAYRQNKLPYIPRWFLNKVKFLKNCYKMCPHCGTIIPLDAKGCDNCLFQFTYKGDKRC